MDIAYIRSFYCQRPARPFAIRTTSGENFIVKNPETMAIGETDGIIVLLPGPGELAMIDISSIIEITRDFTGQEAGPGA